MGLRTSVMLGKAPVQLLALTRIGEVRAQGWKAGMLSEEEPAEWI